MREIIFRGKAIESGEWVYGDLEHNAIFHCGKFADAIYEEGNVIKVDPKTIGQYTGLHDKCGNKIFEGDVVEYYMNIKGDGVGLYNGVVTFCEGCFVVDEEYTLRAIIDISENYGELKVVGNIYDKKEGE